MTRWLVPREHGAYVQLIAPLVVANLAYGVSLAGGLLVVAAAVAFVAYEPLLVARGHRGKRARELYGDRARNHLVVLVPAAIGCAIAGIALADRSARVIATVAAVPGIALVLIAWMRRARTIVGELVAALALPAAGAAAAGANGWPAGDVLWVWGGWALGFGCTVIAIHRLLAHHHARRKGGDYVAACALAVVTVGTAMVGVGYWQLWIASPLALAATIVVGVCPPATRLRAVGIALTVAAAMGDAIGLAMTAAI